MTAAVEPMTPPERARRRKRRVPRRTRRADPVWLRVLLMVGIGGYLLGVGLWAARAGLGLRDDAWTCTRSIRFHGDIANAVNWSAQVLNTARALGAGPDGKPLPADRSPSLGLVLRAEGQTYRDLVSNVPTGDYELDYPPLRLLTMTLWVRHVQAILPPFAAWPGAWRLKYDRKANRATLLTEDVAAPVLRFNAACAGVTSLATFLLVWLWVNRGGRASAAVGAASSVRSRLLRRIFPRRSLAPRRLTPLRRAHGLVLFPLTAFFFFGAIRVAEMPTPAPPPAVTLAQVPTVYAVGTGVRAMVRATVDPQGSPTECHAEWGLREGSYPHATPVQRLGDGPTCDVGLELGDLPPNAVIHYRVVARNGENGAEVRDWGRGISRTEDATLISGPFVQPPQPVDTVNAAWLSPATWCGVGVLFVAMCGAIRVLPPEHRGWAAALVAAVWVWFDPALLMNSVVWPQWDVWVLPFYVGAALLASVDAWLAAGLVMGAGFLFKGQFLLGAGVLVMWPLFTARWESTLRLVVGFLLMSGLVLSPWVLLDDQAFSWSAMPVQWVICVAVAGAVGVVFSLTRWPAWNGLRQLAADVRSVLAHRDSDEIVEPTPARPLWRTTAFCAALLASILAVALLLAHTWPAAAARPRADAVLLLLVLLGVPWILPRRLLHVWGALVLAIGIWSGAAIFPGDWSWKTVGFDYGSHKFDHLSISRGRGGNLPGILEQRFGWATHDDALTVPMPNLASRLYGQPRRPRAAEAAPAWTHRLRLDGTPVVLDLKQSLIGLDLVVLLACGVGVAMQSRRNDPRILSALAAPWMAFPLLLPQMMNRYYVWGGALSSMLIGVSSGLGWIHVLFTLIGTGTICNQMLLQDPGRSPRLQQLFVKITPDDGWILLACTAVVLFTALTPGRARRARQRRLRSG